jgi:hypothetical protein
VIKIPDDVESLAKVDRADIAYEDQCVEIDGIVSPSGQGGWHRDDYDVHCFSLAAWRRVAKALTTRELTILRPIPKGTRGFGDFPEFSIHRFSVLLSKESTRAIFARQLPSGEHDKELFTFGEELKRPVIIHTETFGDLELNRSINRFEGEAEWNG